MNLIPWSNMLSCNSEHEKGHYTIVKNIFFFVYHISDLYHTDWFNRISFYAVGTTMNIIAIFFQIINEGDQFTWFGYIPQTGIQRKQIDMIFEWKQAHDMF